MTWARALSAAIRRLSGISSPARDQPEPTDGEYGPASPTFRTRRNGGPTTSDFAAIIAKRGQRLHNRSKEALTYERTNMALFRGKQ